MIIISEGLAAITAVKSSAIAITSGKDAVTTGKQPEAFGDLPLHPRSPSPMLRRKIMRVVTDTGTTVVCDPAHAREWPTCSTSWPAAPATPW